MKTVPKLLAIAAMAGLWLAPANAAKKTDLSNFHGNYTGDLSISASGFVIPGTTKVKFNVARSGGSAKVVISGKVAAESVMPIGATIVLMRSGKCKVSNLVLGQKVPTRPGPGTYKQKSPTKVVGKASSTVSGQKLGFDCTMNVKRQGRSKKAMRGDIVMTVDGQTFATIAVDAKGR